MTLISDSDVLDGFRCVAHAALRVYTRTETYGGKEMLRLT